MFDGLYLRVSTNNLYTISFSTMYNKKGGGVGGGGGGGDAFSLLRFAYNVYIVTVSTVPTVSKLADI